MAFSSSAANGRRAASLFSSTAAHAIACLLFAIAGLGWSGQSLAQSCDFVSLTPATQVNVPGGTVSFTLEAQTACNTTVDITLGIAPGETTGGAAITPPTAPTIALDTPYTFDVTLGGLEGGSGTVIATCLNGGCAGDTLSFNFATTDIDYLAIPPTSLVVAEGDGFTIGTHVEINGAPTTAISTAFSNVTTGFNYGTVVPDAGGDAMSPTISITGEGSFVLRGTPVCPAAAPIPGCSALLPVDFNVLVEGTSVTAVAPTSVTIPSGDTTTLTAYFGSPSVPEPDGSTLTWSVTQPAGGDGIVTGNPVAGGAGESTGDFTASVPGVYTVTAFTPVTAFLPNTASFTVTVTAVPTLSVEQGDGQVSPVGVPFPDTLMAFADDSGTSPVGLQIDWTLVSGSATFPATSLTDGGGNAEITVTPTAVGPIQIVASRSDAPTATATFNLTATAGTPTITAVSADPGAGTVGSPQAFTVLVESGGLPVVGGTVSWTATAPFAPASGTSTTDASGEATASFTPSAAGNFTNVVTATFDQDGIPSSGDEVSYSFGANVAAVPTLAINAGDGQTGDVGTAYATDLSVTAQNSGLPAGGVTIDWVVTSGSATIVANGPTDFTGGMASATVTPTAAGPITITATRQDAPTATVTFNLTANAVLALTATAGDGQSVDVGTTYPTPLQVLAENSGLGAGGVGIAWAVTSGTATIVASGPTDVNGIATATVTPTSVGPITITATRSDDASVFVTFNLTATAVETLAIAGGNGQTGPVGTAYPVPLSVLAEDSGVAATGIGIDWLVTSGNATLTAATTTDGTGTATNTVTPTAAGPITITASRQDAPTVTVTFNLTATALPYALSAVSANPAAGTVGAPVTFTVALDQGGTPLPAETISWSAGAPFAPASATSATDGAGEASATFTASAAGTFPGAIVATYDPDGVPASGDEVVYAFDANIAAVPTLAIAGGNGQTAQVGTAYPVPLSVLAEDSGVAATGIGIDWLVTSGNATLTAATTTDGTGTATNTVTPTAAGPITITASRQDAPTVTVTFNLTATALPYALSAVSANPAAGTVGAPVTFTVALDQGGTPLPAETISWSAGAPFAPASATSATDGAGEASATFTASAAGTFPGAIVATYDPDGVPASGDEVVYAFDANIAAVPTLAINSGDGQTTPVGTTYPAVLSVLAEDSGVPAAGVVIDWVVTGGTATIVPSGPTDAVGEAHLSVTPTSVGAITITATRQDAPAATVTFNLTATALPKTLTAVTPNPASGVVGTPIDFTVLLEQAGVPQAGGLIAWTATAPFAPANASVGTDASGEATATFTPSAAGTFTGAVTALYDGDGVPASGDELSVVFDVDVTAVASLAITGGDGQAALTGTAFAQPLQVLAEDSGVPAAGVTIDWVVVSGSATLVPGAATDAAGGSSATVTAGAPGPIVITATRADDATAQVTFNLTSTAAAHLLARVSPNPATSTVGVAFPVTVELTQGGVPVAGATVQWNAGASLAPTTASSITDAAGRATTSFTSSAAGTFANAIVAGVDPDGVPANGDEATVAFDVDIAAVASLAIAGGDGQSALPGTTFAAPLQVLAEDSGTPAAGVGITWTLVSGSATIAPAGPTDPTGTASATLTAGAVDGPVVISATRQDAPGATVTFNLTVSALGTLVVVEGDDQTLLAGIPSDPLQVELRDGGGAPVAGATITWSTTAGTLASATSVTDASGIASNTVTTNTVGEVQVTAASPLAGAPAVFALNGGLSNLGGLDPVQQQVVEAIDELCPALAALPSPTPAEADLLARCRELTDAGGIDPDATVIALDELMTDVALAQGQAALLALQAQFQNLKARIAALRSGTRGTSFGGLAVNTSTGPMSLETLASAFTAEDEPEAPAGEAGTDFDRWGFFAAGTIGRGEQDEGSVDPAFDYDIEGLTAGFDYRKSDNLVFGGAFGYTRQDTALPDHGGSVDTTGWTLSGYGTWYTKDSWYADGVVTFGRNDYDLVRHIDYTVPLAGGGTRTIAQTARANAAGDLLQGAFTFGRDFNRGALGIGPYAKLLYTRVSLDAIEEQLDAGELGHGLGLRVEERELTSLASVIGGKLTYTHSTDWGVLMPHLQLEWEHEFKDDPQAIEARFLHDPTSTPMFVRGDAIDTDYFRLGLGLSMVLSRGRSGFLYYEQVLSRDGVSQYNLALGLRLEF